jgi:hypothetical protein
MLTATIESELGRVQVRVDDLSAHGVRVFGDGLFPVDTPVTFQCKGLTVQGFVAWIEAPLGGIGFGEPIETKEVLRTVTAARQVLPKEFRRPGFSQRELTDAERQSLGEWASDGRNRPGE